MKKLFHVLIAGVLVLSVTGCGKSETSRTRNDPLSAPPVSRGAMRNLVSTKGMVSGMVSGALMGMAMNALQLIPGMPKELSTLFGDDGKSEEILAAIAAIEAHLVKIDEKLKQISDQIETVQAGVNDLIGLVKFVIHQNDCDKATNKYEQLQGLTSAIEEQWDKLYGTTANTGLIGGVLRRMREYANNNSLVRPEFTFTTTEKTAFDKAKEILSRNNIELALDTLQRVLLSSANSAGLIVSAQACSSGRFLTSFDSSVNSAVVEGFKVLLEKTATLQLWSAGYGTQDLSLLDFNKTLLDYESIFRKLHVMDSMPIPDGQVFDKQTGKMWTRGKDNVRLVEAMQGCPDASVVNKYLRFIDGNVTVEELGCLASTAIDTPMTDKTTWRLPAIYEISQPATTSEAWKGSGGFPSGGDALFKNWDAQTCGDTRTSQCANPGAFLIANGAAQLVSDATLKPVVATGLQGARSEDGLIWSSTSMAAARNPEAQTDRAVVVTACVSVGCNLAGIVFGSGDVMGNGTIVRENDRSLKTARSPKKVQVVANYCTGYHQLSCGQGQTPYQGRDYGGPDFYQTTSETHLDKQGIQIYQSDQQSLEHVAAYLGGDTKSDRYQAWNARSCDSLYTAVERRVAGDTYRDNCMNYRISDLCHNGVEAFKLTSPRGNYRYGDTPFPHTVASVFTADLSASKSKDERVHAIASAQEWGGSFDCTATKETGRNCCVYTQLSSTVSFPEFGRTLFVRDLKPNEFYTFSDGDVVEKPWRPKSYNKIKEAVSGVISVFSLGGKFNVRSKDLDNGVALCLLDPATAPTTLAMFNVTPKSCEVGVDEYSLEPGPHVVYTMGQSAQKAGGVFTEIGRKEIYFEGTPPPKAEFTVTARDGAIIATLTPPPNNDYTYVATADNGSAQKQTCRITTTTCTISGLANNVLTEVTVKTSWGAQESVSEEKRTTPFGPPPLFTCDPVLEESTKVTLNCSSNIIVPAVPVETPVAKYVVKNGLNASVDCFPATDCVINGLQNGMDTDLEVVATNDFGGTKQFITVRSIGKPAPPTGVRVNGSGGEISVFWTREGNSGGAAAKYVATATNGSDKYSCTSAQTKDAGIVTSAAPTECIITVLREKSNLSYAVAVKGGNGNCSDIVPDVCNYSDSSDPSTPTTIRPQFKPDSPTLKAEVENSKITVTAKAGTNNAGSTNKITIASDGLSSCDASVSNQWKCVFDNFMRDQIYTFTGTGYNDNSVAGSSDKSNAVTVYTAPTAPVISQTTTFDKKIYVTIGSSTAVIDSYTVTTNPGGRTCKISRPNQSCEVTGLTNGTAYSVSATAQNNGGVSGPSDLVSGLKPFGVPTAQIAPAAKLDTRGGSAVFHLSVLPPDNGVDITTYEVRMVNAGKSCTIVAPGTTCDISVEDRYRGFEYQFISTATNRIGESFPSLPSKTIAYEDAPLAPRDVILTTNYRDILVKVLPDADSSIATKFAVTASSPSGNYSDTCAADGICVLKDAARGKEYIVTMKAINVSGTSPVSNRRYYLSAPPEAPQDLTTAVSLGGMVVDLGAGKPPTGTDSMLVTATPSLGGAPLSCTIILPAKTCVIKSDPTKTYKISAVGEATSGETPSASKSFKPTGIVKTIAVATQNLVAPVATESSTKVTAAPQINKTIILGKKSTSKIKIDSVYSAYIKSLPLSAGKVSLLKFSVKVKSDSKKICTTKGSDVILLKKGVCNISAKFKVVENKKSTTVELPAKITVR